VHDIARKQTTKGKKRHCTNNNKKYINKEREKERKRLETRRKKNRNIGGIEMNCTHTNRFFRSTKRKTFFLSYITTEI